MSLSLLTFPDLLVKQNDCKYLWATAEQSIKIAKVIQKIRFPSNITEYVQRWDSTSAFETLPVSLTHVVLKAIDVFHLCSFFVS